MADENRPATVYSEADIEKFLTDISDPDERERKGAFFKGYGELFAAMGTRHALAPTDSSQTIDRLVESVATVAERITG